MRVLNGMSVHDAACDFVIMLGSTIILMCWGPMIYILHEEMKKKKNI